MDAAGQPVRLGKLIARGGEGVVHELAGRSDTVVKLYHQPPRGEQREKLAAMPAAGTPQLLKVAAWPLGTVHSPAQEVVGLAMPRVAGDEVHELYSPAGRRLRFPDKDWRFLILVARNCAAAVQTVHDAAHVIGDVNQKNVLVTKDGPVWLIDCDSFQVASRGRVFRCPVGVPEYTPPELQGNSFRDLDRTPNHDRFGLAVLVFHLLFMGRHPFIGSYSGKGDMPPDQAIREYRYAYSGDAGRLLMHPPPGTLPVAAVAPDLPPLFERAFTAGSERPAARPTAREWHDALGRLEQTLTGCQINPGHLYPKHLAGCMWCKLVASGRRDFFDTVPGAKTAPLSRSKLTSGTANAAAIWSEIERVGLTPTPAYVRPPVPTTLTPAPLPRAVLDAHQRMMQSLWGQFRRVFDPGYGELRTLPEYKVEAARRQTLHRQTLAALEQAERTRAAKASSLTTALAKKVGELRRTYSELRQLDKVRAGERAALEQKAQADQLDQYLSRRFLSQAKLKNIGPGRLATLRSYGVETAADITPANLAGVPGFGKMLTATLTAWRIACEQKHRPKARPAVPAADLAALDQRHATRVQHFVTALERGCQELESVARAATGDIQQQDRTISSVLLPAYAQAQADAQATPL